MDHFLVHNMMNSQLSMNDDDGAFARVLEPRRLVMSRTTGQPIAFEEDHENVVDDMLQLLLEDADVPVVLPGTITRRSISRPPTRCSPHVVIDPFLPRQEVEPRDLPVWSTTTTATGAVYDRSIGPASTLTDTITTEKGWTVAAKKQEQDGDSHSISNSSSSPEFPTTTSNCDEEECVVVMVPGPSDVLFGRGKFHREHSGNARMRSLVAMYREAYLQAKDHRQTKMEITKQIVKTIQSDGGRFLKLAAFKTKSWYEVSDETAREKVGHAIRDCKAGPSLM